MTKCLHYRRGPPADPPGRALVSALSPRPRKELGPLRCAAPAHRQQPRGKAEARAAGAAGDRFCAGSTFPSPQALQPQIPSFLAFSLFGGHSPAQIRSPSPRPSRIRTTGRPSPPSLPHPRPSRDASLTRGVSQQTCPQSLPNLRTKPQVLPAQRTQAELRGWG